jgi:cytochrome oxidase Cu insertion factor (SCO1/SenC/PrrC family)
VGVRRAFGGLFAPGLTFLSGAPGGVLFYVVAGGLLVLPDRSWATRQLGRVITGSLGVFLLVMAVLQAWPGRGFWQGTVAGRPGTLAAMIQTMATIPQPHVLASTVSAFGSFDQAHGFAVNLFAVVVLAAIGVGLLWGGRFLYPALLALIVVGVADWVLIEDFGVWGGTGTDPNSMVPMLLLAVCGYLALVRAPAVVPAGSTVPAVTAEEVRAAPGDTGVPEVVGGRRAWWEKIDPGYAGRLAAALGAVVIVLIGTAPMVAAAVDPNADTLLAQSVNGTPTAIDGPAPKFDLVDQHGRPVSLADLRGYTVALTFLDPVCTTDCPIIAQEFRQANQMLGGQSGKVRFVAIDANPEYTSVGALTAFDRQEGPAAQPNWLYLTGSVSTLQAIWNDYGVSVATAPAGGMAVHSDLAYVIGPEGNTRRVLNADPGGATAADQSSFATVLSEQITQVLHS